MKSRFEINLTKFFSVLLISFVAIQVVSYILSEVMGYELLKLGWVLLLFLATIGIVSLFVLGRRLGQLDLKKDLPFILLVFGGIVAAFVFLPDYLPKIFSTQSIEFGESIKEVMISIIKLSPGGVA